MIRSRAFVRRICSASLAVILELLSWSMGNLPPGMTLICYNAQYQGDSAPGKYRCLGSSGNGGVTGDAR